MSPATIAGLNERDTQTTYRIIVEKHLETFEEMEVPVSTVHDRLVVSVFSLIAERIKQAVLVEQNRRRSFQRDSSYILPVRCYHLQKKR